MYYIDAYLKKITEEKDPYAPPERYIEYLEGISESVVKEKYIISYNPLKVIDFSYSANEERDMIPMKRSVFFKMNNLPNNLILFAYTVPPQWFKEKIEEYNKTK